MIGLHWRQIHWPTPLPVDRAAALLERLAAEHDRDPLIVQAIGDAGAVRFELATTPRALPDLAHLLAALLPGTTLDSTTAPEWGVTLRVQLSDGGLGLRTDRLVETSRDVLAALAATRPDERLMVQLVLGDGRPGRVGPVTAGDPSQGLLSKALLGTRPAPARTATQMANRESEPHLQVALRIAATTGSAYRSRDLLRSLIAALRTATAPGTRLGFVGMSTRNLGRPPRRGYRSLTAREVLAVAGWPLGSGAHPGLPAVHPRVLRLPEGDAAPERAFATSTAPGDRRPLGVSIQDALHHSVILGPTGTGKSTLLQHLIAADMNAGRSIVVLDAKADLVADALRLVPEERREDVVVLDPARERPVGLNPLVQPGRSPELIADSILTVIRELFPNLFGPRTSDVLHASLLTLTSIPGATLTWLPRLLTEGAFRREVMPRIDDDILVAFWQQFDAMSAAQQAQFVGPVLSRLRQFLLRPTLRRMLDHPEPRFHLEDLFAPGKRPLLFMPLNAGLLGGEATRLLGSLLLGQLWGLTLARAATPANQRMPVSVYVDEAQEFVRLGGELADALARSRSLGVAWHLAHQYRQQFSPDVLSAIDANCRTKITFTLGPKDARDLAAMAPELTADDFMSLPRHHIYTSLVRGGQPLGWASGRTLPPPAAVSNPTELLRGSARRYGNSPPATSPKKSADPAAEDGIGRRRRQS